MKFNDGFWLLKHNVRAYYGLQVVGQSVEDDAYHLQVATKPIRHRGDTLGGPLLSVKVHAPTEGVIGVTIDHFKASLLHYLVYLSIDPEAERDCCKQHSDPYPEIQLFPDVKPNPKASLSKVDSTLKISSGDLTAEITSNPYTITFKSPKKILASAGYKHQAVIDVPYKWTLNSATNTSCLANDPSSNPNPGTTPPTVRYINSELTISPGELFYGLGERFGAFVKNGKLVKILGVQGSRV